MSASTLRLIVLVSGRVQGVGYRMFARRVALDLGLSGHAENLADGRVEVVAEGNEADLKRFLHRLGGGPPHALVRSLETQWSEGAGLNGFAIH